MSKQKGKLMWKALFILFTGVVVATSYRQPQGKTGIVYEVVEIMDLILGFATILLIAYLLAVLICGEQRGSRKQ